MIKNNKFILIGSLALAIAFVVAPTFVEAYTQIGNTTLRVGSKGANVTSLQQLLASNSDMYPSGTQDGIFGSKTKSGVVQFQLAYGLTADGIVGPITRNKVNDVVVAGNGIDVSNAGIYNLAVTYSGNNEVLSFNTSEPVKAAVFYDTNPINWNNWNDEVMSLNTPEISGTQNVDNTFSTNKIFTLSNLPTNTRYNYTITTTDQAGNTSVIWPTTFYTSH